MNFIRRFLARLVSFEVKQLEDEVLDWKRNIDELSKHNKHLKTMCDNMFLQSNGLIVDKSILEKGVERLESRRAGLADANLRQTLRIKEQEQQISELKERNEYLQRLNAHYAADRQDMIADKDPFYAERNFPRVTKFLNRKNQEEKGE